MARLLGRLLELNRVETRSLYFFIRSCREADQLARNLAQRTGETITQAVITVLRERLAREQRKDETVAPRYLPILL